MVDGQWLIVNWRTTLVQRTTILRGVNIIINGGLIVDPNSTVLQIYCFVFVFPNRPKTWQGIFAYEWSDQQ